MSTYPRHEVEITHLHFGPGNFFRSLIAPLSDEWMQTLFEAGIPTWNKRGTCTVSTRSDHTFFRDQDSLFTLNLRKPNGDQEFRIIRSVKDYLFSKDEKQNQRAMEYLVSPSLRFVTLTVKPEGYLQFNGDLANPDKPTSPIGMITLALKTRFERGISPFVVMSCDNMPPNGRMAKNAVIQYALQTNQPKLAEFMHCVRFPSTCVDRITPNTDPNDLDNLENFLGVRDDCAVVAESHRRLVIQTVNRRGDKSFPNGIPWEGLPGVITTTDATPYAEMKAHLVNSSHMIIAWLGTRMGYSQVHQVLATPSMKNFMRNVLTDEIAPLTPKCDGIDIREEIDAVVDRLSSPHVPDQVARLNRGASKKIPERVIRLVEQGLEKGTKIDGLCLTVAAWIAANFHRNELHGETPGLIDDNEFIKKVDRILEVHRTPLAALPDFLNMYEIFGTVRHNDIFCDSLVTALKSFNAGKKIIDIANEYNEGKYNYQ